MELHPFTALFAALLLAWLLTHLWLLTRQMRHVARHAGEVPGDFAATVNAEQHRRAARYTLARGRLELLSAAATAVTLLGWTLFGGLDALNVWIQQSLPDGPAGRFTALGYQLGLLAAFAVVAGLLDAPFSLYRTFVLEQRFGFNRTTLRVYLADALKGLLVGAALFLPIAALVLTLMAEAGRWWWAWAWGAWMAFNLLLIVVFPTWIAPLFNQFTALEDGELRTRLEALMRRCGFEPRGLFVMDGSRRSSHGNAYFTGLGRARRVVFFDTLLDKLTPDEVVAVLAHELGHGHHRHVFKRVVMMGLVSAAGFALLGWLSERLWFYAALGVQPSVALPNDALALILFLLVVPLAGYFLSPWSARLSRRHEFQADAFAAAQSEPGALASALVKLHQDNASTLTPDPLYVRFHYSHPPAAQRLQALKALASPAIEPLHPRPAHP